MRKVTLLRGSLAAALTGLFILTLASGEARRVHDPNTNTKIRTEREPQAGEKQDFRARIDSLIKEADAMQEKPEPLFSVPKTLSEYDTAIIGTPLASQEQCVDYLLSVNPTPAISVTPRELVSYYYEEGAREGIRPDVAFAQALKETGFFRYGGTVTPDQNNYCGLGTTSATVKGAYFATSQLGVRAHIQHLLAYASTREPIQPVVDPRYDLVRNVYGTNTLGHWQDLNGRWAVPGDSYGQSILSMFRAILRK
ncbi:glucosaminidase domain-containing protein [Selenomonas sp. oral taxon 138]|uniref:glucosaminidase domain-containing protein n=1 Tax=Selenomonas sp. oral taxon 138 TaxID=712532 RepID=UPI0002A409DE|nr:glucosaminidase domain-containing protein [Selenomonas sp. oral taxon 138]EKY01559.1 hypothetical protein HMPREF9163_00204 [Selenomonas sp. oral taxon 138 str. F0429]